MTLHVPTMFAMTMAVSAVMGVSLAVIAWRRHRELRAWSGALFLQLAAYVLISLRGQIPDVLSIVAANLAVTGSIVMFAAGLHRFHREPLPAAVAWLPLLVIGVGFAFLMHDFRGRVLLTGVVWLTQCGYLLVVLHRRRARTVGRGQYLLAAAAGVYMLAMIHRLVAVPLALDPVVALTDQTPLVIFNYLASLAGTMLLSIGVVTMIQERAEQTARVSEERYRTVIDAATEGIVVMQDGRMRMVNPRMAELTGFSLDELIDRPVLDFLNPEDRPRVEAAWRERASGRDGHRTLVVRGATRLRGERWFEVSGVAFTWHGRPATLDFISDVTEQRDATERIRALAFEDPLTGLPNRRLFLDHLGMAIAANARSGHHGAILFMDLDNFKMLNDRHGHAAGDLLLVEVGRRLRHAIRATDTVARFGGDEFVVLLTDLSPAPAMARAQAADLAQKIRAVLAEPYRLALARDGAGVTIEHRCTATTGMVVFAGDDVAPGVLIDRADAAMYSAKQAGRNRVGFEAAGG